MSINPIILAALHQKAAADKRLLIQADVGCIRQLLIGRKVRRKGQLAVSYNVTEVRMNLSGVAEIRGKLFGAGRTKHIGTIAELEMVEP